MKVWARYAVPVMVLVDEHQDSIERVVMVPGERLIDRETMGDMLFYSEELKQMPSSERQAAHALYIGDTDRWPDPAAWEIEETFDALTDRVHELRNPPCPDCDGEGYHWPDQEAEGIPCRRCAGNSVIDRDLGRHADAPEHDQHGTPWPSVQ
jgi:hypothetical protein